MGHSRCLVDDGSQTNPMTGWNQVFTLGSDGTVTVQKFNHTVIRHVNENYGTITPFHDFDEKNLGAFAIALVYFLPTRLCWFRPGPSGNLGS